MCEPGTKYDGEKPRWDLLPWAEVEEVAKVLTYGARKYAPDNWKFVVPLRARYFAAAMRHIMAWWGGEVLDRESGLSHLAHATCCLLFCMWGDKKSRATVEASCSDDTTNSPAADSGSRFPPRV